LVDTYIIERRNDRKNVEKSETSSRFIPSSRLTVDNSLITKDLINYGLIEKANTIESSFSAREAGKKTGSLNYTTLEVIENELNLSRFEVALMNSIGTLIEAGNEFLTINRICSLISGNKSTHVSNDTRKKVEILLDNLHKTEVEIDRTEVMEQFGLDGELIIKGQILNYDEVIHILNNKKSKAYRFYRLPLLYTNAKDINHIYSLESNRLSLPEDVRFSTTNIVLNLYINDLINVMINKHGKWSNSIDLSKIYEKIEEENNKLDTKFQKIPKPLTPRQKNTIKNNSISILDKLVDCKVIAGYEYEGTTRAKNEKFIIKLL
jgi:hypothetical protein